MIFRIRYRLLGGHYHCRFFAGPHSAALGKCGDLCMRKEEFELFRDISIHIEFKEEEDFEP